MKKKMTERTRQSAAAQKNAIRLLPTNRVNHGDTPPKIIQVTSPNAMKTV
jgi:hypothetical protein